MILKINKQKLHKVHEINDNVRNNGLFINPKIEDSIGEQIISNKITYSGIRQYNPKKPVKWGFKNFAHSRSSRRMYDIFSYSGETWNSEKCTGSYPVLKLIETLPSIKTLKNFFDSWFCYLICYYHQEVGSKKF